MLHLLILAASLPREVVDTAALLSGVNDTTEFVAKHIVPAYVGGHGIFAIAKRFRHRK